MADRKHVWDLMGAWLVILALIGVVLLGGGGASSVRAVEGAPVAATPVAVPAEPAPDEPVVTLVVERAETAFGVVTGTGEVDAAAGGVERVVDESGAYYVKREAIRVVVTTTGPWTGACHAGENGGSATTVRVGEGRLEWRLAGAETWSALASNPADPIAGACFPDHPTGTTSYSYDLRLRVERDDPPGTFAAGITFAVAPAGSL